MRDNPVKENQKTTRRARLQNARPTIGFLTHGVADAFGSALWRGVADEALEQGANLLCFVGQSLSNPRGFEHQANVLYDLVHAESVGGLVISGILGEFIGREKVMEFYGHYRHLPMVETGLTLEGIPSVIADNRSGMRDLIVHLIGVHGCRRIAFIRGPEGSQDVEERYRAYTDTLAEYGLPLDLDLVVRGDNQLPSGVTAMNLLLDERQVEFEAVVANNDNMALGVLQALQARGMRVPHGVAVVGFDDIEESRDVTPPLTTCLLYTSDAADE